MIKNTVITLAYLELSNLPTEEILLQQIFLVVQQNKNGEISLEKDHHFGYFIQVQVAMGLSHVNYCDLLYSSLNSCKLHDHSKN